jgi:cyclopropane-fatty-acyl-phospholipid synthase
MKRWIENYAKSKFFTALNGMQDGYLELVCPEETYVFGDPKSPLKAMAVVHDDRFFARAAMGADVGIGESYMDGDWTSPDLVALVRVVTRNLRLFDSKNRALSVLKRVASRWQHRLRDNSVSGSRENIRAHYDLGNEFYRLFLDERMMYSCGYFLDKSDSLEDAQLQKMDLICRKLRILPGDRVLEIGCGWGAFAVHAARNYGANVTGVTISPAQFEEATRRVSNCEIGPGTLKLVMQDYRLLQGQYDKIVCIEMFEAVGLAYYDKFFQICDRLLAPDGSMLMQTITMPDQELKEYRQRVDWIQSYIFPGSDLAFLSEIQRSLAQVTQMSITNLENFGMHYVKTLSIWRERFFQKLGEVQALGFDERFQRMWDFYLAWCEGAFRERYINVAHVLMAKNGTGKALLGDPVYMQEAVGAK